MRSGADLGPDNPGPPLHFRHRGLMAKEIRDGHQVPALTFVTEADRRNLLCRYPATEEDRQPGRVHHRRENPSPDQARLCQMEAKLLTKLAQEAVLGAFRAFAPASGKIPVPGPGQGGMVVAKAGQDAPFAEERGLRPDKVHPIWNR